MMNALIIEEFLRGFTNSTTDSLIVQYHNLTYNHKGAIWCFVGLDDILVKSNNEIGMLPSIIIWNKTMDIMRTNLVVTRNFLKSFY